MAASPPSKDAVPPRRPTATAGARRPPAPSSTPARAATATAASTRSSTLAGSSLSKPAVRRAPAAAPRASPATKTFSRQSLAPSTSTAPARAAPRASLAARPSGPTTASRPATTTKAASSPVPTTPTGHAKKLSTASDAEVGSRKSALAPVKAQRPDTAPTGPAEMGVEMKRRSAQIMQDFFKETSLRDRLQEQCDDLNREVDKLQADRARLKKQLLDAQAAMAEKDQAGANDTPDALVHDMEAKFAHDTKQLEEQSQQLEAEKKAAQEQSALEAARAGELQQVLDHLNSELEQQGREWDAEKKMLAEQAAQVDELTRQAATLTDERDALSAHLASAKDALDALQTRFAQAESTRSDDQQTRDAEIKSLKMLVQELQSEIATSHMEHTEALAHAQRSLESNSSETSAVVESLQAQIESLHHQHTEELRVKDEAIALHVETEKGLYDDIKTLQQRANQITAILESERNAHAEEMEKQVEEWDKTASEELRIREEDVSRHLETIDNLQGHIIALEQGSTDGARVAEELHKQIKELTSSHEAAIKAKTDENEELVQQLDAMNDQLSADAAEVEQLKEELIGLRTTLETLEKTSQQQESQHVATLATVHADLNEAVKKADSYKLELDAVQDKHRQNLRVLSQDHEGEIESLRADLEGDAKERLSKLQAEVDSLKSEKTATWTQHEEALAERTEELEALKKEIASLKESSGSTSQQVDDLHTRCRQAGEDKAALMESHSTAQREIEDLHSQLGELTKQATAAEDLLLRLEVLGEEKAAAEAAHVQSKDIIADLQARHDSLLADKAAAEESHHQALESLKQESDSALKHQLDELVSKYEALVEEKSAADELHAREIKSFNEASANATEDGLNELQSKYDALLEEKSANDAIHMRTLEELKEESANASTSLLSELQVKHDELQKQFEDASQTLADLQTKHQALSEEKSGVELAHGEELERLQDQRDAYSKQLGDLEKVYAETLAAQSTLQESHTKELATVQVDVERNYANLLQALQSDTARLEEEKSSALNELNDVRQEMKTKVDDLKAELASRHQSGSAGLAEATARYEALCAEKALADREHEDAIAHLRASLEAVHEQALAELRTENEALQQKFAAMEQEHGNAIELLKEEFKAGHSDDVDSLRQQLKTLQEQHIALAEEKVATEQAHEDAISELLVGMQASNSDAVQQWQKKYDALVAQIEATQASHNAELEATRQDVANQQLQYRDLLSRNDKATADAAARAQEVTRLMDMMHQVESKRAQALRAAEEAEDRIETMKGEVVRKHLARVEPLEKENAMLVDKVDRLEAIIAAGDRIARAAATVGEKRHINTLTEEDEDDDEEQQEDTTSGAQELKPNGAPADVVGTLAAMQETLSQLSALNNDAIAESSRTAQRLTEQH